MIDKNIKISAVIFDLDGTILDNEDEYASAFRSVLKSLGKEVDEEFPHTGGVGVKENWPILIKKYRISTQKSLEELTHETQKEYLKQLDRVTFKPDFLEFLRSLKESQIATALATSNTWVIVEKVLEKFNMENYFDCLTTSEEVGENKPSPQIYLKTADKLGIKPQECVVLEDSAAGVKSALAAGMNVIGIARNENHAQELKEANSIIYSYSQLLEQQE